MDTEYSKNLQKLFLKDKIKYNLPIVFEFLHNPEFVYSIKDHYDLGIEDACGVLYLNHKNKKDLKFLKDLEKMFPFEINNMKNDKRLWHPSFQHPMSIIDDTRFANNNIAAFMESTMGNPMRVKIMRRIIFHLLSSEP
jgi:hypothetical protein